MSIDPHNLEYLSVRIDAYIALQNIEEALKDIKKMIEIAPNSPKGYHKLGQLYSIASEFEQAKESFENGLQFDGSYYPILEGLDQMNEKISKLKLEDSIRKGIKYYEENNITLAIDYFNDAIKEQPSNIYFYSLRATATAQLCQHTQAIEDINKILQLSPIWAKVKRKKYFSPF